MRYVMAMVTVVAWGLWFGGMGALFLFVSYLFVTDRATAVLAAPRMFAVFETYQFIVAAVALVAAVLWWIVAPAGRTAITVITLLLALSAAGTVYSAVAIRRPMERLRVEGDSGRGEFQRLHKQSERLYSAQAAALLVAGIILPAALREPRRPRTAPEAAEPTTPPAGPAGPVA